MRRIGLIFFTLCCNTGWTSRVRFPVVVGIYSLRHRVQTESVINLASYIQWVPENLSAGVKRPRREADRALISI